MGKWADKVPWTAEQWRAYRRSKGVPPKADMPTFIPEHIYQAGRELSAMMMLPALDWPTDLFGRALTVDQVVSGAKKNAGENLCGCGCGQKHRNAVSRVVEEDGFGVRSRRIVWYISLEHRNRHMGVTR